MKSKEELIKQIVILFVILLAVIIVAVILNISGNEKDKQTSINSNKSENITNTENESYNEMLENLKGLLDTSGQDDLQGDTKEPIKTGITEELKTNDNQVVRYEEIWNE